MLENGEITNLFQSTPSTRRETYAMVSGADSSSFQSTPSTRRETRGGWVCSVSVFISIHSLHTEGDMKSSQFRAFLGSFQSTPSTRRETGHTQIDTHSRKFQSTPSTRRETRRRISIDGKVSISIHSLHTEGDIQVIIRLRNQDISIHSLHTEGDLHTSFFCTSMQYFNPLPPHGGRRTSAQKQ